MGKIEKWHLLPSYRRYLDASFIEMFLKQVSISRIHFADLDHMTKMAAMPIYSKTPKKTSPEPVGQLQWNLVCSIKDKGPS